jgi:hypothetical protein
MLAPETRGLMQKNPNNPLNPSNQGSDNFCQAPFH